MQSGERHFSEQLQRVCEELLAHRELHFFGLTGPTCSGKTTAAKKLIHHLGDEERRVVTVSLDDFFKDCFSREDIAKTKVEDLDFDSPDTLDVELLSRFVDEIFTKGKAEKPIFDFVTGGRSRYEEIECKENDVLLFEGIQVLYPAVLSVIESHGGRILCVRPESGIEICGKRFEPDFIRLCRRLVRDANFRGATPDFTLSLWDSVRRNEEENIFPHISRCTVSVDTTLAYELNVLSPYLRRILPSVTWGSKHHKKCLDILGLLEDVVGIESFVISDDSLYKEFV